MSVLIAEGLTKIYGANGTRCAALGGVDFTITAPQSVALMGPSGSGKSTLLHLLGALDRPTTGSVRLDDVSISGLTGHALAAHRRRVGFVFQRYNVVSTLTAMDNVILPLLPYRTSFSKRERAMELLDRVGLADRHDARPGELSGGQQQRVAIARALMVDPVMVVADEPTGSLDSATAAQVVELLTKVCRESAAILVMATHDAVVASRCQRIITLHDGVISDDVALEEPADPESTWKALGGPVTAGPS